MNTWAHLGIQDGISAYRLNSWSQFFDFLEAEVFNPEIAEGQSYIWRGQRRSDWSLNTSLDRQLERLGLASLPQDKLEDESAKHLERFQYATRGRRGPSPASLRENEWWALGQHFGLATPLLDWTRSPFAALYFAYEETSPDPERSRAIYGLDENAILTKLAEADNGPSVENGRLPIVELVDPMSDENQRLVSQGGCFTRAPIGTPIEGWVSSEFEGLKQATLMKIELPNFDRLSCLQALNRMNINHLSLFPDLSGASRSTNLRLEFLAPDLVRRHGKNSLHAHLEG